jgi:type IV secretory pathway protease TraF
MKPVIARAGDVVDFGRDGISVNGKFIPNTSPRPTDTLGRPLVHWPFGRYLVPPGTVCVTSSYNARSYDSRYFGPIATTSIRNHLKRLMAFS